MKDEIDKLKIIYRKFKDRREISAKTEHPHLIQVNGHELYPIFADVRDHILVTGQTLSSAPVYGINLTKQLLLKKHVIHAKTTYAGARCLWNLLFCFGFLTEKTSTRLVGCNRFAKNAPRFSFHLYHDKHHIVEDTVNDGNLTYLDMGDDEPVEVVFYLNQHADESFDEILKRDQLVDEIIAELLELRPSLITRLTMQLFAEELPDPSELSPGFNHIIVTKNASSQALKYKNRLHSRDVLESFKIYFPDPKYNPCWRLHQYPLGHWCVITPGVDPIIQRAALKRTPYYFSWRKADGQ
jgi:hypothetical protein